MAVWLWSQTRGHISRIVTTAACLQWPAIASTTSLSMSELVPKTITRDDLNAFGTSHPLPQRHIGGRTDCVEHPTAQTKEALGPNPQILLDFLTRWTPPLIPPFEDADDSAWPIIWVHSFIYSFLISFPSSWCPTFSNPVVTVRSISPSRELPTYLVLLRLRHSLVHVVSRSSSVHLSFLTPHLRTRVVRELECRPGYHIRVAYFSFCNRQPCPSRCSLF